MLKLFSRPGVSDQIVATMPTLALPRNAWWRERRLLLRLLCLFGFHSDRRIGGRCQAHDAEGREVNQRYVAGVTEYLLRWHACRRCLRQRKACEPI